MDYIHRLCVYSGPNKPRITIVPIFLANFLTARDPDIRHHPDQRVSSQGTTIRKAAGSETYPLVQVDRVMDTTFRSYKKDLEDFGGSLGERPCQSQGIPRVL